MGAATLRPTGNRKRPTAKKRPVSSPQQDVNQRSLPTQADPPPGETDPTRVNRPISTAIHNNLKDAWMINKALPMCFIFDSVSPARRFKRGMLYTDDGDFPDYNEEDVGDVTETDTDLPGLMPYMPDEYQ